MSETTLTITIEEIGGWDTQAQYVTYSVDGLPASRVDLSKRPWHFQARPCSRIKFTIHQDKKKSFLSSERPLGHFEEELHVLLTRPAQQAFNFTLPTENSQSALRMSLTMSADKLPEDGKVPTNTADDALRLSLQVLETLLTKDGQQDADVQRICQSSKRLLECVDQIAGPTVRQSEAIKTLFEGLKNTLDYTQSIRSSITDFSLSELAEFIATSAALLDECIKHALSKSDRDLRRLTPIFQSKLLGYQKQLDVAFLDSYNKKIKPPRPVKHAHNPTRASKEPVSPPSLPTTLKP